MEKKKKQSSPFNIIFILMAAVYLLTFIIPSGEFVRVGKTIDPSSFHLIEKTFLFPKEILFAMPKHAYNTMGRLFITMMIVGGTLKVVSDTKTLDLGIHVLSNKFGNKVLFLIPLLFAFTGFLGTASVMISTVIAFIPLGLTIARRLDVDNIFAVALMFLGSYTGFMASPISPVTTAIAQELAGIQVFSGFKYRLILTVILVSITAAYLTFYAYRVRKNKANSVMDEVTLAELETEDISDTTFTKRNLLIFLIFTGGFLLFSYGSANWKYGVSELASIMIVVAIICGFIGKMSSYEISNSFVKGAQGMVMPILFMVLSGAIAVILDKGQIMDSIVYYSSIPLGAFGKYFAAEGMFISNAIINYAIPSGSGQAVVVMPIMAPLADVVGISRQTAVLAYQLGDGFTNLLNPTNAILLGSLSMAKCGLKDWFKLIMPLYCIFFVVITIALAVAVAMNWS